MAPTHERARDVCARLVPHLASICRAHGRRGLLEDYVDPSTVLVQDYFIGRRVHHGFQGWREDLGHWLPKKKDLPAALSINEPIQRDRRHEVLQTILNDAFARIAKRDEVRRLCVETSSDEREMIFGHPDEWKMHRMMRVGTTFFIDAEYFPQLPKDLRRRLSRYALVIPRMGENFIGRYDYIKHHTVASMLGLSHIECAGKTVIECGAGDGALSLSALKHGARQAILIDYEQVHLEKAREDFAANGFDITGDRNRFIRGDLRMTEVLARQIGELSGEVILVSNIGNWPEIYGDTNNSTSIALMAALQKNCRVTHAVLGGYVKGSPAHRPQEDVAQLKPLSLTLPLFRAQVADSEAFVFAAG